MTNVVNINEVLDGHVTLEVECVDRLYLNAYVPNLQTSGQVAYFMRDHLGMPIPSPAVMEKIGNRFVVRSRPSPPSTRSRSSS